jgi:hypothetical protein
MFSFTSLPLYPRGKSPRYPLVRRMGEPHSRSGRRGEEKILDPTGTRTPTPARPARSQSLYRLRYPGSRLVAILFFIIKLQNRKDEGVTRPHIQVGSSITSRSPFCLSILDFSFVCCEITLFVSTIERNWIVLADLPFPCPPLSRT